MILSILKFLLILLLLGVLICLSSIAVHMRYWDGVLKWSIHWFGIKIFPLPFKLKRRGKKVSADTAVKKTKKKSSPEKKIQKKPFMDNISAKMQKALQTLDKAESGIYALSPALRHLGNALTWYAIETDILIATEDAADCARQYGIMQILLQNLFTQTGNWIHVKRKRIQLRYDFVQDKSQYNIKFRVKLHIGRTIIAVIVFLWHYVRSKNHDNQ